MSDTAAPVGRTAAQRPVRRPPAPAPAPVDPRALPASGGASPGPHPVRWEFLLPAGKPVPANLGGLFEVVGHQDDGATAIWLMLPVEGDRPEYDPRLPPPAFVVDNFLVPTPPFGPGDLPGPMLIHHRFDADGDIVAVHSEPWDPEADPIFGPLLRAAR